MTYLYVPVLTFKRIINQKKGKFFRSGEINNHDENLLKCKKKYITCIL